MSVMNFDLQNLLNGLPFPIIACEKEDKQVLCINSDARLLTETVLYKGVRLEDVLHCRYESDLRLFWKTLETKGIVQNFALDSFDKRGDPLSLSLTAQILPTDGKEIVILNLAIKNKDNNVACPIDDTHENGLLFKMLYMTYHSMDLDKTIGEILEILGNHLNVNRAYVFEEISSEIFSNTYEWCSSATNSQMDFCQGLPRDGFSWEAIQSGLYVASDIGSLPLKDRLILEPQDIKALVILPLFINNSPVGFIGCDECKHLRIWKHQELQLIQSSSAIISTLLSRKRALQAAERYQEIMCTVMDNIKAVIYVSDFDTHQILFANKYLKEMLAEKNGDLPQLEGKICWQVLQKNQTGPCLFCPKPRLLDNKGRPRGEITWEHKNENINKWYLVTDSAVQWVDGQYVHMENARDISDLKQKEEELREKAGELKVAASTDSLTGIYNRQMGTILLEEAYKRVSRTQKKSTLCFMDLDGLKKVNDTYGHREGDQMIVSFVNIVKEVIRGADILCRWGGDEFIVLLEGCDSQKAEEFTIQRVNSKIKAFNEARTMENYELGFSYGLEEINAKNKQSLDQLIALADMKMYENKVKKRTVNMTPA